MLTGEADRCRGGGSARDAFLSAAALGAPGVTSRLSATIPSITTGGGRSLLLTFGSVTAKPLIVVNQRRPSRPFQPAGLAAPVHCTPTMPSSLPKVAQEMDPTFLASKSSRLFFSARNTPFGQLIQRQPALSSSNSRMSSLKRPCRVV